jgi:acyl carrier protein
MNAFIYRFIHSRLEYVEATVLQVVKAFPKVQPESVTKTSLLKNLNIDSLSKIDLILDLEDKFQLTLPSEEILKIQTVMDAISIFNKYS